MRCKNKKCKGNLKLASKFNGYEKYVCDKCGLSRDVFNSLKNKKEGG